MASEIIYHAYSYMKKSAIVIGVLATILGLIIIFASIDIEIRGEDAFKLVKSFEPITKVEITVISAPHIDEKAGKKAITISDRTVLDSLSSSLRNLKNAVRVDIAKLNDVYVEMDVYKNKQKASLLVVHSIYTGWVLSVGDTKFKDDYVFELIQRYLPK